MPYDGAMRGLVSLLPAICLLAACGQGASEPPSPSASQGVGSPTVSVPPSASVAPLGTKPEAAVTLVAAGDVMLGRSLGDGIRAHGADWPWQNVRDVLSAADLTFVNLESPLTTAEGALRKDFVFRGPPEGAKGLAAAGVDIVSLANNHALDYGFRGLQDTWVALNAAGVRYVGSGDAVATAYAPTVLERNGLRIAFLAYVNTPPDSGTGFDLSAYEATADRPGVAWLSPAAVAADVAAAKRSADIVVVSMHTGDEYQEQVSVLQASAAHSAIEAGAALVLGHHPHVLQGLESYKTGLIAYSLGNFVFDFDEVDYAHPDLPSALSAVLEVRLSREGVVTCRVVPMVVSDDGRPRPAEREEAERVLGRLRALSDGSCGL